MTCNQATTTMCILCQNMKTDRYTCISQIPQFIRQIEISVTRWLIVGYGTAALWDLCDRSIVETIPNVALFPGSVVRMFGTQVPALPDHSRHVNRKESLQ